MKYQSNTYTLVNLNIVVRRLIPFTLLINVFIIISTFTANVVILLHLPSADSYCVFIIYCHDMWFLITFVLQGFTNPDCNC